MNHLCRSLVSERRRSPFSRALATALAAVALALPVSLSAQNIVTDNFDSGALDTSESGWQVRNVLQPLGGAVENSFVDSGSGKAFRIKRGSANMAPLGQPQPYGTGRAWLFRTNEYTDFYVAMDLVDWDNNTNQAIVLLARAGGFNDAPLGVPGLGAVNGYVANYDNVQDGTGAGDRLGGQFQINRITGEAPSTIAVAEVTLIPGRTYRMAFQGVGSVLTARLYDSEDYTRPIAEITAEDGTYASGNSGIATFHRDDTVHPNMTDMTMDNYYSGPSDPNTTGAIRHSVPGTPVVTIRNPTNRFTNFHPAQNGISFTASTHTAGQIDTAATRLWINGVDHSSALTPLPANGSTVAFTTAAGTLEANKTYHARIVLSDTTGLLKSTNTFWFDTFEQDFLRTTPAKTIEAEDYNYGGGLFQQDPIPVSGVDSNGGIVEGVDTGKGYYNQPGVANVDFFKPGGFYKARFSEYRLADRVQITQGSWWFTSSDDEAGDIGNATGDIRIHDTQRQTYVAKDVKEYQVRLTSPGDWMNYTRTFEPGNYKVYVRAGSFGATTLHLDKVTSDPAVENQTTTRLGSFNVSNHLTRLNYAYEPLMNGTVPAVLTLSGTNTLRLTMGGTPIKDERTVVLDYLLFVPTSAGPTIVDDFNDGNDNAGVVWQRFDPLGGVTAAPATFEFPSGGYRILSPIPQAPDAGTARAGSFIKDVTYTDFYISVDVIDYDDTVRQVFGLAARINDPGLGTTGGYIFTWEPGSGALPTATGGDLDVLRLVGEVPTGQIETESSSLHLERGNDYRFVFMGKGFDFVGKIYQLPDTSNPIKVLPAHDANEAYASGQVGLIIADQTSGDPNVADATFDNFLATFAEPKISFSNSGSSVTLTWPQIPFRLQSSPSLDTPVWTDVTAGITQAGDMNSLTVQATANAFYRLVYP